MQIQRDIITESATQHILIKATLRDLKQLKRTKSESGAEADAAAKTVESDWTKKKRLSRSK